MLGREVAAHRRRAGLTQEELAERTGLSVRSIRDIEADRVARPRASTVRLLADAFGLDDAARARFRQAADPAPATVVPAQLPLDVPGFAGRDRELIQLDAAAQGSSSVVLLFAVGGMAGVGKTALALHWAHRTAGRFPDGQLYVNLRGFDAPGSVVDPADALRGFLEALDVPPARMPTGLDARAALFRSVLNGRRMLVLLDNARDDAQVRPLLPGAGSCVVLVTSRDRLSGLVTAENARLLSLDVMSGDEARGLLAGRIGAGRLSAEPHAADTIIDATAGLPLALAIVAARVAGNPTFPLAAFADELREAGGSLDAFGEGDIRRFFTWSYDALQPPAARLFRLIALHPGPHLTAPAAAALAGTPAVALLAELARLHLLSELAPRRFGMHDLLRAFAAELTAATETPDERAAAQERLFDYYLHAAFTAARLLQPQWVPIDPTPPKGAALPRIRDHDEATAWFTEEIDALLGTVRLAADNGFDTYAWQLAWTAAAYLAPRGLWPDAAAVQEIALECAERSGDRLGEATARRLLSRAEIRLGRHASAEAHLRRAFDLYRQLTDAEGQAQTLHNLAELLATTGRAGEALTVEQDALRLYRLAGNLDGTARTLNGVGWLHAMAGEYSEAVARCTEALAIQEARGDHNGQAATLDSLGYAYERWGQPERAAETFERAIEQFRRSADRYHEAETLVRLGDVRAGQGDTTAARTIWRRALRILDDLGDAAAAGVRRRLTP